eukprot:3719459-Rhodomonas_salina.1
MLSKDVGEQLQWSVEEELEGGEGEEGCEEEGELDRSNPCSEREGACTNGGSEIRAWIFKVPEVSGWSSSC